MPVFPQLERIMWLDDRLKRRRFINASHLAEQFEISRKTAQRDVAFLRDRLRAPLAYDHLKKGYYYTDKAFELPRLPATQEEVLAVLIARRLLSHATGGIISEAFRNFSRKLREAAAAFGLDETRLEEAFSSSWHGYSPAPERIFNEVARALLEGRLMEIDYHSPGSSAHTRRIIEPHHLQHYMASWVLIAYCRLREDWRKFFLSRIEGLESLPATFAVRPREQWAPHLDGAFGIFRGAASIPVTLRFNPFRSRWVREQHWHPAQAVRETVEGGIELSFPVADFREVKMMILQFGADVQVLAPEALREEIRAEVARLNGIYRLPDEAGGILPDQGVGSEQR